MESTPQGEYFLTMSWLKSFFRGMSYITIFPRPRKFSRYYDGGFERDKEAIADDWRKVMEDLRKAENDLGRR